MSINKSLQQHRRVRNTVINVSILIAVFALYIDSLGILLSAVTMINWYGWKLVKEDKSKAQKREVFRIPETSFLLVSMCGGAIGTFIAMRIYRHKTKHILLSLGILFLVIFNVFIFYFGFTLFTN